MRSNRPLVEFSAERQPDGAWKVDMPDGTSVLCYTQDEVREAAQVWIAQVKLVEGNRAAGLPDLDA